MGPIIQHIVCYILLSLFKPWARADFFTATMGMEPLLETHKRIMDDLDDYITKEEERLAVLKNHSELFTKEHEKAMEDIPNYLGNPLNVFTLIKRLTSDLYEIDDSIKSGTGTVRTALEWTKKLLKLDPNHPRLAVNVRNKALAEQKADTSVETEDEEAKSNRLSKKQDDYPIVKEKYEALCLGEMEINSDVAKRLFCRYMFETHPFLRLAPIKEEQVYIDPDVFVFHGVLSDDEIQFLKVLSTPRLKRADFPDKKTGKLVFESFRVCKLAWLNDEESQVVARVSQRVADMTGLSMESAEELQVVNYGIGGHYEPHYDFYSKPELDLPQHYFMDNGNRIATVLFYMSDVAQGGATVFTELGLAVFPTRGAALYWRNLHPSGEGDTATRHAACPVLRGSKWVSSKWLHVAGQELIKPCELERKEMVRKIPRAVVGFAN